MNSHYDRNMNYPTMQSPMQAGTMKGYDHQKEMYDFCRNYKDHYVMMETDDGKVYDGIIMNVEADNVVILMPVGDQRPEEFDENRQFGYGGYGYPYGGYGRFPFRFRRFHRFTFPFFGIRRFFFPFFF
ncbi:hypothetical protein [Oceanobacillus senegalensis]|uniref:hypothetical protein n=1 Tax=Oceanobacillus senegalensis TaxID=1936063 RepID=UPI00117DD97D|nr:hypothetical protein [Oceanobacillus senegalensis]